MTTSAAVSLRARGHDAVALKEGGLRRSRDHIVLWSAVRQRRTVLTHNGGDFALLHGAWTIWGLEPPHFGILVVPQRYRLSGPEIADAAIALVESGRPLRNELYLLGRDDVWTQPSV